VASSCGHGNELLVPKKAEYFLSDSQLFEKIFAVDLSAVLLRIQEGPRSVSVFSWVLPVSRSRSMFWDSRLRKISHDQFLSHPFQSTILSDSTI
jgi:hypothetical protein